MSTPSSIFGIIMQTTYTAAYLAHITACPFVAVSIKAILSRTHPHVLRCHCTHKSPTCAPTLCDPSHTHIFIRRFCLQILRAVIETAAPAEDEMEGLPGVWQAGGAGSGGGVSTNEGHRGKKVDIEAIRLDRVSCIAVPTSSR